MPVQSLSKILANYSNTEMLRSQKFVQLQRCWSQVVGEAVAPHTRPVRLQDGILYVAASSSVWAQNLQYQRRLLIDKITEIWIGGEAIRDLRFETTGWHTTYKKSRRSLVNSDHPSFGRLKRAPVEPVVGETLLEQKFNRLRSLARWRTSQMATCPRCRMAATPGELERWQMCGCCVVENAR